MSAAAMSAAAMPATSLRKARNNKRQRYCKQSESVFHAAPPIKHLQAACRWS